MALWNSELFLEIYGVARIMIQEEVMHHGKNNICAHVVVGTCLFSAKFDYPESRANFLQDPLSKSYSSIDLGLTSNPSRIFRRGQ